MYVSLFHGSQDDPIQIVCHESLYVERLLSLGFVRAPEELPKAIKLEETKPATKKTKQVN